MSYDVSELNMHVQTVNRALPGDVATQYAWNRLLAELDRAHDEITELGNKFVAASQRVEHCETCEHQDNGLCSGAGR